MTLKDKHGACLDPGDKVLTDGLWIHMFVADEQHHGPEFVVLQRGPAREVVAVSEVRIVAKASAKKPAEAELETLLRFVLETPHGSGWEVADRAGHQFAALTAKVTDKYVWYLQLEPALRSEWTARCQKGEEEIEPRVGSFSDCVEWLQNREKEWQRELRVANHIEEFAAGRPHWRFFDQPQGRYYAGRTFKYDGSGEKFLLSVLPHTPCMRHSRFRAQINMSFAAGPEHVYVGDTIDQVAEWVKQWEKLLSLPLQLAECSREEAAERVGRLSGSEVASLAYLLDIPGSVQVSRRRLVEKFNRG